MIKRVTVLSVMTALVCCTFTTNAQTAVDHLNELMESFDGLKKDTWTYLKAVTRGKGARNVEKQRQKLIVEYSTQKSNVMKMSSYKGDRSLKDAVIAYLDLSRTVLKEDFAKILDMEDIAEQSYDAMEAYLLAKEKAGEKMNVAWDKLLLAQTKFCDINDINLTDGEQDKMSAKIERANEMLKYYNTIYLIYFKPFKQEAYAIDAMNRGDVSGIEQNSTALGKLAEEASVKLKEAGSYRGDGSLRFATEEALKFYRAEAKSDFPAIVDFYIKKDNFEKVEAMVNGKSAKKRTQADIDKYNKASEEYNNAVNLFNAKNDAMNTKRVKLMTTWNNKVDKFYETHSK